MLKFRLISAISKTLRSPSNSVACMSFKSELSLDKLYPYSTELKAFKPPEAVGGKFTGYIPIKELQIKSTRASGPGGQCVNKTETKVDVRFHVKTAKWISESTKQKLQEKFYTRINKDGYFVMKSEKTRSKLINTADAVAHIREMIFKLEEPEEVPDEKSLEKIKKNKEKAERQRLMEKRRHSLFRRAKLLQIDY